MTKNFNTQNIWIPTLNPPKSADITTWLHHLETLHPKTIDLGLERIQTVANRLKILPFKIPVIMVAGTNGKGSTVATLESVYHTAGYRVGTYTSPHLITFHERVRINQKMLSHTDWVSAFEKVEAVRGDITLTYFEFSTLAAFLLLQQAPLDIVILEIGMGGRLDAVNIVDADVAVITNVSLDHCDWLGDTREKIAAEKAGILRKKKPLVYGETDVPLAIQERVQALHGSLHLAAPPYPEFTKHQKLSAVNINTALTAVQLLQDRLPISKKIIQQAVQTVSLKGRFDVHSYKNTTVILDVAHNPAAFMFLSRQLQTQPCKGCTLVVLGMLADKDMVLSLKNLTVSVDVWHLATITDEKRAATAQQLVDALLQSRPAALYHLYPDVLSAWHAAQQGAQQEDRIVVCGSFHTVGPVIQEITT